MARFRRYMVAGVLVWVPALVTVLVLRFLVNSLDSTLTLLPPEYQPKVWLGFNIPGLGIVLTFVVLLVTGMLAANFVGRALLEGWESLLGRIPFIRNLYSGVKQVAEHLFDESGPPFKQVVLVEYPRRGIWSLGFLTSDRSGEPHVKTDEPGLVSIFVPTTPNPTSGFLLMAPRDELVMLDMKVEDAMKMIISMGVVIPVWQNRLAKMAGKEIGAGAVDPAAGKARRPSDKALKAAVAAAAESAGVRLSPTDGDTGTDPEPSVPLGPAGEATSGGHDDAADPDGLARRHSSS
jgi:uncharacterized membrane protein